MKRQILHAVVLLLLSSVSYAAQPGWYLFARDDGCIDMQVIVRKEKLARSPVSPEDFAQLMRDRGERVVIGMPEGFPPELAGKLVQVQYGGRRSLIFVKDEICRSGKSVQNH